VDNDIISGSTAYVAQVVYNATTGHWLLTDPATGAQPLTGFSNITTGTNTTATMTVGSGAEITVTGAGINNANEINGVSLGSLASCIIFNTTSTGILSCLTVGSGLSLSGSTLTATGSGGTVTSVATTSPITGGTITTTGTIGCATCVVAPSPGAGIARFAGSTQTVTSAELSADVITSGSNAVTVNKIHGGSTQTAVNYNLSEKAIASAWNSLSSAAAQYFSSGYSGTIPANWSGTTAGTSVLKCKTLPSGTITWTVKDETASTTLGTFAITSGGTVTLATTGGSTATVTAGNVVSVTPSGTDSSAIGCVFTGYFTVTGP
jgi:hypothetical protein